MGRGHYQTGRDGRRRFVEVRVGGQSVQPLVELHPSVLQEIGSRRANNLRRAVVHGCQHDTSRIERVDDLLAVVIGTVLTPTHLPNVNLIPKAVDRVAKLGRGHRAH